MGNAAFIVVIKAITDVTHYTSIHFVTDSKVALEIKLFKYKLVKNVNNVT